MSQVQAKKPLSNNEISAFASQMGMMISAGITVDEALRLIETDSDTEEGKELIKTIYTTLEDGNTLYHSMSVSGLFPKYVLDMVNIGEQTGNLDNVFSSLADYYEREENIAEGIKQAVTYPFIMIIMMLCVILVLIIKVLPIFQQVYEQLGTSMTGISASILNLGTTMGNYSAIFITVFILIIIGYFYFTKSEKGKLQLQDFAAAFPITKSLYDKISAGRFASGMALAIGSGFTTEEAVVMIRELITNKIYDKKIDACNEFMHDGMVFADAAVKAEIFSGTYGRMVSIGFKSGNLDVVMGKVATRYEREVDQEIGHFVSILEPTLVAILSIIVGMILLSVMLPLMGIMSSIG